MIISDIDWKTGYKKYNVKNIKLIMICWDSNRDTFLLHKFCTYSQTSKYPHQILELIKYNLRSKQTIQ